MTAVKICGLTNLQDARWASQCGADLLGFVFVRSSPRYIPPATASDIARLLMGGGCGALLVGVFANASIRGVRQIVESCMLDLVQLHGDETPDYAHALSVPVIVARRLRDQVPWDELSAYQAYAYLFDSYDPRKLGGTGRPWRWQLLRSRPELPAKVMVAGGLTPENVALAIDQARPWGVDVSSGVEACPGRKDPDKVERFIQNAKQADTPL